MNQQRRNVLAKIVDSLTDAKDLIEEVGNEESTSFDNLPENLKESDKWKVLETNSEALEEAVSYIEQAIDKINETIEKE